MAITQIEQERVKDLNLKADGAASSTDNAVARFDGVTGKLLQNSVILINDVGDISAINSLGFPDGLGNYSIDNLDGNLRFSAQTGTTTNEVFMNKVSTNPNFQVTETRVSSDPGCEIRVAATGGVSNNTSSFTLQSGANTWTLQHQETNDLLELLYNGVSKFSFRADSYYQNTRSTGSSIGSVSIASLGGKASSFSTTSTSFVNTGLSTSLTVTGTKPVIVFMQGGQLFCGSTPATATTMSAEFRLIIDGATTTNPIQLGVQTDNTVNWRGLSVPTGSFHYVVTGLSGASHTFQVQCRRVSGNGAIGILNSPSIVVYEL